MVVAATFESSLRLDLLLKFLGALLLGVAIALARRCWHFEEDCKVDSMPAGDKAAVGSMKRKKGKANKSREEDAASAATQGSSDVAKEAAGTVDAATPPQDGELPPEAHEEGEADGAQGSLEVWEIPPLTADLEGPPTETEKALLRVTKKLREVKAIEACIRSGEVVEQNRLAKAQRKAELVEEWLRLSGDVEWERGHAGKCSREFVTVRPGVSASRLRTEATKLVEEEEAAAMCADTAAAWSNAAAAVVAAPVQKSKSAKRRARKAGQDAAADDDAGWTVVGKSKEKARQDLPEEERAARVATHKFRQAMRVQSELSEEYRLTHESLQSLPLFTSTECEELEALIEKVVIDAQRGLFKPHSVDLTPMRNKYFFGFAYTYGAQKEHPGAHGVEAVWPPEDTSPIPAWIHEKIISKLEARRVVPKGWINSATINDYAPGGCIVSHIDPPWLFDRPIIGLNLFSDCNLVFGTKFSFPHEADIETTTPVLVHRSLRGHATVMKGYSANKITHAIRPCDLPTRRAAIILRRVLPSAPVLTKGKVVPLSEHLKQRGSGS
mmetsp:Transcript_5613/g.9367  ORF Transcript_5613/g.9367 Transcript_5613/m.9367 type:complete len:554 (-) Transcript_5613:147-1808(-)